MDNEDKPGIRGFLQTLVPGFVFPLDSIVLLLEGGGLSVSKGGHTPTAWLGLPTSGWDLNLSWNYKLPSLHMTAISSVGEDGY